MAEIQGDMGTGIGALGTALLLSPQLEAAPLIDGSFGLREAFAFPNPAHANPTIRVKVGLADEVKIRIYNEAAEKVEEGLLNQASVEGNEYAYDYHVSGLASGVYLYFVEAKKDGEVVRTRGKLAIIR